MSGLSFVYLIAVYAIQLVLQGRLSGQDQGSRTRFIRIVCSVWYQLFK